MKRHPRCISRKFWAAAPLPGQQFRLYDKPIIKIEFYDQDSFHTGISTRWFVRQEVRQVVTEVLSDTKKIQKTNSKMWYLKMGGKRDKVSEIGGCRETGQAVFCIPCSLKLLRLKMLSPIRPASVHDKVQGNFEHLFSTFTMQIGKNWIKPASGICFW